MRCIKTTLAAAACATLALTAATATAQSSPSDRTTFVTFSGPVSVPGMTLPAGTYTFRIMDSMTDRHIVQIFDRDQMKLFTTLLAVPAERNEPSGDSVITFKEAPVNMPPAVHYWYYAGEKAGNELVYPKKQAVLIAKASGESVMSVDSDSASVDGYKSGKMARVTSTDTVEDTVTVPPPVAAAPEATPAPVTTPAPTSVSTSHELPKTASTLPLVGLIGLLALAGAVAFRAARTA